MNVVFLDKKRRDHYGIPNTPTGKTLVAEASADGHFVAALGAAAREHGGSGLGLHAAEEAVGL